jgi:hypothetical protein
VLALAAKSLPGEHHEGSRLTGERR